MANENIFVYEKYFFFLKTYYLNLVIYFISHKILLQNTSLAKILIHLYVYLKLSFFIIIIIEISLLSNYYIC